MIRAISKALSFRRSGWPGALIGAALALVYALTLQRQINGATHLQMMDVAEMQIALATWGTLHPAGYPLYTILGNLFVAFWKVWGVPAAVASAGFSLVLGVATLALLYRLVWEMTGRALAAVTAAVLLGISRTFWLFSSVAQTYTMNSLLMVLLIWLSLRYSRHGRERDLILLGVVSGATLAHHRTIVHLLPWLGLLVILPVMWRLRPWRALLVGSVLGFLPLALYLYIPLRAAQGAFYQYMPVRTLEEFWYFVSQQEYSPHFRFVGSVAEALERMRHSLDLWLADLSAAGLLAGIVGLLAGSWRSPERRLMLALACSALSMMIFPLWYVDPDSMFIPLVLILAIGAGALVDLATNRWRYAPWVAGAMLAGVVALLLPGNFQFVRSITRNSASQDLIDAAASIDQACPTILSHWGWDLKAYQYGQAVTGQLKCAQVVTPSDDLRALLASGQSLYVAAHFFYQMSLQEFHQRVGETRLSSAGVGVVEVSARAKNDMPTGLAGQPTPMGAEIVLLGYHLDYTTGGVLDLTLYWQTRAKPAGDYSVFVHLSDQDQITSPEHIIAQADSQAPVYGWYPTMQWSAGEIVREDYRLVVPPGKTPRSLAVGMYTQDAAGAFHNLGLVNISLDFQE